MNRVLIAATSIALAAAAILTACGGGSSSNMSSGASSMARASGVITGFGSVFVNGQEFATGAQTRVLDGDNDDAAASTSSLAVGMTVDVDADGGNATMLRFTSAVRGEVDAVDPMHGTLTVLGQTVQTTSGTSFAGTVGGVAGAATVTQLTDITVGNYVVVFGYIECSTADCSGATTIVATLVNEPAAVGMYRVQGTVNNSTSSSFTMNGLTVDITSSTVCNTMMPCSFANGDFVSVRSKTPPSGSFSAATLTLTADAVKRRSEAPTFALGSTVTIEGPVRQLNGTMFVVRGIPIDASGIASSVAGLVDNQIVEVSGTISSNGTLVATSIDVEQHATFAVMGPVGSVSAMGFSVLGLNFTVTDKTRFADWMIGGQPFNAANFASVLKAGDQVIVAAYPSGGSNVATRVEVIPTPSSPAAAVEGVVSADNAPTDTMMTVAGISVTLNGNTQLFYPGAGPMPTLMGFFGAITPNTTIGAAFGTPVAGSSAITAADAAVLAPASHWMD
jgi:hypothetical protein